MDTKLKFTGGEPDMTEEAFLRTQNSTRLFIHALGDALGRLGISTSDPYIVQGCSATVASSKLTVTAGYIYLGGEIVQVDAQTDVPLGVGETTWIYQVQTTYEAAGDKVYKNSISRQTYEKKRGVLTGVVSVGAGELAYNGDRLVDVFADQLRASTPEAQALLINNKFITPATLADVNGGTLTKVVTIGDWDMDTVDEVEVAHGISNAKNIRVAGVMIRDDADLLYNPLNVTDLAGLCMGSVVNVNAPAGTPGTTILLRRTTGGLFDGTFYNSTSFNRGWITIQYEI